MYSTATVLNLVPQAFDEAQAAIRVVIADEQALIRAGLRVLLESEDDIVVVGEAADGEQAVELALSRRPDVILMDIDMPKLDGVAATLRIVGEDQLGGVSVLMMTTPESDEHIFEALRGGARGFLGKDSDPAELLTAVRVVASGEAQLSPSFTRRLIDEFAAWPDRHAPATPQLEELTLREREVMALVAHGLTNHEIAERLVISPATAKTHVSRAMVKLHARDRAQLVVLAYQAGLVVPGGPAPKSRAASIARRLTGSVALLQPA
jgi:DNA-binding NarL/FixJ family response regulator